MVEFLRWLLAIELIGAAFLPLAVWALGRLPDRGYVFAKVLGLLLVTYVTWLIGSLVPIARSPLLPSLVVLVAAVAGWWFWYQRTVETLREVRRAVVVEEAIFVVALLAWSLMRVNVFGSAIEHTEKFMDMAFLNASIHAASYPPYDPWMSGHTINYYYFGYLMFGTLAKLSGVAPAFAFNLSICTVFALTVSCAYGLGYALSRRLQWAAVSPVFLALIGNWHAILWQLPHSGCARAANSTFWGSFWESTRVVGAGYNLANWACGSAAGSQQPTISEYPLFSFILADLHPHVMALPITLLALALGASVVLGDGGLSVQRSATSAGRLLLFAVCIGALFTINSWDFPTYLVVVVACTVAAAYFHDDRVNWWTMPSITSVVLAILSFAVYAPFYLHFRSAAQGIGRVVTPSDLYEFIQVFGLFLLVAGVLIVSLSLLLQPAVEEEEEEGAEPALAAETGEARLGFASGSDRSGLAILVVVIALALTSILLHLAVLALLVGGAIAALAMLRRVLNTEEPNRGDAVALILVATGCLVVALPELVYLRDVFDGGPDYRMNTVFKFYYQGWTLLSIAGGYGVFRVWTVLKTYFASRYAWLAVCAVGAGTLAAGIYTLWTPSASVQAGPPTLDGSAWIDQAYPGDAAGIRWLSAHATGTPVILEAPGAEYSDGSLISTFTGLPTVMGWSGHEDQWRVGDPDIAVRTGDANKIYSTSDPGTAKRLLLYFDVRYVIVGEQEQKAYAKSEADLGKFAGFMRAAYRAPGITIYGW